jgi:hypothetical protein
LSWRSRKKREVFLDILMQVVEKNMQTIPIGFAPNNNKLYTWWATALALITIFYTMAEGLLPVFSGLEDESISLFGFGLNSFIDIVSSIGIWHMIRRIRRNDGENPRRFKESALRITGTAFYALTTGLAVTSLSTATEDTNQRVLFGTSLSRLYRSLPCGRSFAPR